MSTTPALSLSKNTTVGVTVGLMMVIAGGLIYIGKFGDDIMDAIQDVEKHSQRIIKNEDAIKENQRNISRIEEKLDDIDYALRTSISNEERILEILESKD